MLQPRIRGLKLRAVGRDQLLEDTCANPMHEHDLWDTAYTAHSAMERAWLKRERKARRTELVPKTIAPNWELLGRRRVEVACRETAETTVSETGVTLLVDEVLEVEAELVNAVLVLLLEAEVEERIVERAAHQELEREVVRALGRLARVVQLRLVPVHLWRDIGRNESECIRE